MPKTDDKIKITPTTEYLSTPLTEEELRENADSLAGKLNERDQVEHESKSISKQFKSEIEKLTSEIHELQNLQSTKKRYGKVDCEEIKNFTQATVSLRRLDTHEIFKSRAMRQDEKQMEITPSLPVEDPAE